MRFATWNVNGIRSVEKKGFLEWLESSGADCVALQETKASPDQLSVFLREPAGYQSYWASAQKAGYSGVAIYSKHTPKEVHTGIGLPICDAEGRVLALEFSDLVFISTYFPNSQRDHARLPEKLEFCEAFGRWAEGFRARGLRVVVCGDLNIAHREIDLKNPKANQDNAGFLPEERAWMEKWVGTGLQHGVEVREPWVDAFRYLHPDARDQYTWWSYRPGVRERNIGWRLDYFVTSPEVRSQISSVTHEMHVKGSDHCPVVLELRQ